MLDTETNQSEEALSTSSSVEETQPEQPTEEASSQQSEQQIQEKYQAKNFKILRDQAQRAERERDELARRLKEIESRNVSLPEESDDFNLAPDDLAEGKHLSKVAQKIKKLEQQVYVSSTESRLKSQFPDFDKVVSKENIEALKEAEPELADAITASSDLYSKAVSAYKLIKKLGIHQESGLFEQEKAVAQRNASKPKPLASVSPQQGDSPLSKANAFANGLTEELKAQLRREMEEARRAS